MEDWKKQFNKQFGGIYILDREPKKIFEQLQAFISQVEAEAIKREEEGCGKAIKQVNQMALEMESEAYETAAKIVEVRMEAIKQGSTGLTLEGELIVLAQVIRELKGGDIHDKASTEA